MWWNFTGDLILLSVKSHDCIDFIGKISSNNVQEPKAKAALIWMLGEYAQDMQDAPFALEGLIKDWEDETSREMKLHESLHGPSLTGSDWASSIDTSDPGFTPLHDSQSSRYSVHPRITTDFKTEHHFGDYAMRNKLDVLSTNPVDDRLQKLQKRPVDKLKYYLLN
ncbi:AP-1, 2,4 complex subunit beta [Artemisia annua]|uniref:AP-1, 2,4 complex subunit beta n=1 Tax=Artemisia annua TaxID=35608 RepID=A0A2U1KEI9_ARTAN|nr:AP-1, 2,4 complex subunit beta [Artemisia annua]